MKYIYLCATFFLYKEDAEEPSARHASGHIALDLMAHECTAVTCTVLQRMSVMGYGYVQGHPPLG